MLALARRLPLLAERVVVLQLTMSTLALRRIWLVRTTLRTELRGGSGAEADAARRLAACNLARCGRRAAVTLGGFLAGSAGGPAYRPLVSSCAELGRPWMNLCVYGVLYVR